MNKKLILSILYTCFSLPLFLSASTWTMSAKISCFAPKSSHLSKVYGNTFVNYEIEATRAIFCNWEVWTALDYYTQTGKLRERGQQSRIQVLPLSLGLSYNWRIRHNLFWNIGAGGAYTYAHFNQYEGRKNSLTKWGGGGVFKTCLKYYFCSGVFVSAFVEYFYQHFNHHRYLDSSNTQSQSDSFINPQSTRQKRKPSLNVGGTRIGLSVGFIF